MTGIDIDDRPWASPFREMLGLKLVTWDEQRCEVEIPIRRELTNFVGAVAGPVLAAAVDMAGVLAGCYRAAPAPPRRAVTVSLTVSFLGTTETGGLVRASATSVGGGKTLFTSVVDVTNDRGDRVATGQCVCRYIG